ncbi:DUF4190 domain-containing protein [Bacteroidales bacterium OttesenSCG-928-I14]|nr:DUF4190 domain-containing protein [Bacteroidales bacterium OttesenSCG-928-I14]
MNSDYNPPLRDDEFQGNQIPLPNATVVLVLGILSIIGCCCYSVPGIILAIVAIIMANSATKQYLSNPAMFTSASYSNLKAGKVCAIIALVLSILYLVSMIIMIAAIGIDAMTDPEALQELLQQYQ